MGGEVLPGLKPGRIKVLRFTTLKAWCFYPKTGDLGAILGVTAGEERGYNLTKDY